MATKAKIRDYLHGYPNLLGNKKQAVISMKGPTDYLAGGVNIDIPAHVKNVHYIHCTGATDGTDFFTVVPLLSPTKPQSLADVKLAFIDAATGLEPADATDLSTFIFVMSVVGTN